jgi:hypothetical protein
MTPLLIALHVRFYPDLSAAVYTWACCPPGATRPIGGVHLLDPSEATEEDAAWCAGLIEAATRGLILCDEEGRGRGVTVQADRRALQRLLDRGWPGTLGQSCIRLRAIMASGILRIRSRAGGQQTPDERERVEALSRDVALGLVAPERRPALRGAA